MSGRDSVEMRGRVARGLAWKVASAIVLQGSRIVVAVVLARLLSPHDYGLAGMVLVFSALVYVFADLGLGASLVQRTELTEADRSTVFWTSTGAGVLFTLAAVGCSWPLAAFYGEPKVQPLFAALSLSFFVTALGQTQHALMTRAMNFRSLELRMMAGSLAGAAVGIAVAAVGLGAWAIIVQQLTIAAVSTTLLWFFSDWRPRLVFSLASLRALGGFGGNVFGTRLLFYVNRNADNLLVGRFLGPAALGAYSLAYNTMLFPFNQIASPIQEVLFPAFARMQDDPERMGAAWIRVNRVVGAISIPALVGLMVVAPDFVRVVFGERWHTAAPVIQILAWVGLLQSLQRLNSSILQARNQTRVLLRYSIVVLAASLAAFGGGLHWGIVGVATGYAISSTIVEPYYTHVTGRAIGLTLLAFVRGLRGVALASLAMGGAVLAARLVLQAHGVAPGGRLAVAIVLGVAVYGVALPLCDRGLVGDVRGLRSRRRPPALAEEALEPAA